ncbi:MAG TPA: AAA family ATPase [Roseiflexaceae bacterium]|nr:AAA family ATPase [Roseiflexaceae bacterium]HMP39817.1 AAA family ATPase [Roseiflexaceae bacterium]
MANAGTRIIVVTAPERLEQAWIERLGAEEGIAQVERVGVLGAGLDLVQQLRPDIVIVDRELQESEQFIRQIFTSLPLTLCIAVVSTPDTTTLRRLVTAGARDVLPRPLQLAELLESIRTAMATEADRRSRAIVSSGPSMSSARGRLVVVTSPKGGAGTTTVTTNLAVALRQISAGRILLADFCLQFGDVGVQLNLWSKYTMHDLLARADEIDDAMIAPVVQTHSSGLQVLFAPQTPEAIGDITAEQIEVLLDRLLERYDYVIADTWSFLDEIVETLLRRADEILVVTTPEVPSLKNVKRFLEYVQREVELRGQITLVLNRFPSVDGVSLDDVKQHLRYPIGANIPSEGRLVTHSVNRGIPVVISHPQSWVGQSLIKLAARIAGERVNTISLSPEQERANDKTAGSRRRGLFGFVRRD